jgi:hypothetical protein
VAFKNRGLAKRVGARPCEWCGWQAGRRFAAHIIDEGPETEWNAISLCPNCSTVFDEKVRPMLWRSLSKWGVKGLPKSWSKDNKISSIGAQGGRDPSAPV